MITDWIDLLREAVARPLFVLGCGTLLALVVIFLISILNAVTFPRLQPARPARLPFVSILVPARNEARNIPANLRALLLQDYPRFEIILLDDHSDDDTYLQAQQVAQGDERFRLVRGERLPGGWLGKNWACHQLATLAQGDLLVFTDADVTWHPGALTALVAAIDQHKAAVFTVWPTQQTISLSERLVIPMMMFVVLGYLPEIFVRFLPFPVFAAANGQCLAFSREAYTRMGGHAAVATDIVEDVALSRLAKAKGLRLVMGLGVQFFTARMYQGWDSVRRGFAKNILAGHGSSTFFLALSALFHWSLFLFPWLWLLSGFIFPQDDLWPAFPLALVLLGLSARAATAITARLRLTEALWMPFSVILMSLIAGQALLWHYRDGGPQWKGRAIAVGELRNQSSGENPDLGQDSSPAA